MHQTNPQAKPSPSSLDWLCLAAGFVVLTGVVVYAARIASLSPEGFSDLMRSLMGITYYSTTVGLLVLAVVARRRGWLRHEVLQGLLLAAAALLLLASIAYAVDGAGRVDTDVILAAGGYLLIIAPVMLPLLLLATALSPNATQPVGGPSPILAVVAGVCIVYSFYIAIRLLDSSTFQSPGWDLLGTLTQPFGLSLLLLAATMPSHWRARKLVLPAVLCFLVAAFALTYHSVERSQEPLVLAIFQGSASYFGLGLVLLAVSGIRLDAGSVVWPLLVMSGAIVLGGRALHQYERLSSDFEIYVFIATAITPFALGALALACSDYFDSDPEPGEAPASTAQPSTRSTSL